MFKSTSIFFTCKFKKKIVLGCDFSYQIDNLPDSIEHLILGEYYDKLLNKLPKSLIYLELNNNYEYIVDDLPKTIKKIKIGYELYKNI